MITRTVTLSAEHWQRIIDALLHGMGVRVGLPREGWKSPILSAAVAALDAALAQPEPVGPSDEVKGLHGKFIIHKANGGPVKYPCFVLRIDGKDAAAISAFRAYAIATEDTRLRQDMLELISPLAQPEPPSRLRHCPTHGQQPENAWGCPECVREMRQQLSQPEPGRPSQQQIEELLQAISNAYSAWGWVPEKDFQCLLEEVSRLAGIVEEGWDATLEPEETKAKARAALARFAQPTLTPIPVSERLPGEGDLDAGRRCWYFGESCDGMAAAPTWVLTWRGDDDTHWLPAHALPLPAAPEEGE